MTYHFKEIKVKKVKTPIPQGMISLTEAAGVIGKPYGYLYFSMIFWIPILEILVINGHRYCSLQRVECVRELIGTGHTPSFKYNGATAKNAHTLESITEFGVMWIKK